MLLSIGLFLLHNAKNIKVQREDQINQITQKIQQLNTKLQVLHKEKQHFQSLIQKEKLQLDNLHSINLKTDEEHSKKINYLNKYYDEKKQQIYQEYQNYKDQLQLEYQLEEANNDIKIKQLLAKKESIETQIDQIKKVYDAVTAARLREKEQKEKESFYRINITDKQISDISKLQQWKYNLYDPTIVAKIIWSSYIIKPTSNLCNRVVGSSQVCGIYKITNINTGDIYIGQSVNITDRFKQHIKCGLGIDASPTNKLYNNMQQFGVWNFTFEILEKCERSQLNEKERFWIDMYQSNKVGLNTMKGSK